MNTSAIRNRARLMTPDELADLIGVKPRTLQNWRSARYGPAFIKAGKAVLYSEDAVNRWLRENERARA